MSSCSLSLLVHVCNCNTLEVSRINWGFKASLGCIVSPGGWGVSQGYLARPFQRNKGRKERRGREEKKAKPVQARHISVRGSGIQGHLQLQSEFEVSLDNLRPYLKKQATSKIFYVLYTTFLSPTVTLLCSCIL